MSVYARNENDAMNGAGRLLANAAQAARGADARLNAVMNDLFLADEHRPNDRQRVIMARLLKQVVGDVEADLRADLLAIWGDEIPLQLAAVLGTARVEIAGPILARANLLRDAQFVRLLLDRAEEHRIVSALRRMSSVDPEGTPQGALGFDSADTDGAALEMAVLIAESRRFDRAQDPVLVARDLPADVQHKLLWSVAAALRDYIIGNHGLAAAQVDPVIIRAAMRGLANHDEGEGLDSVTERLARYREARGQGTDQALYNALRAGRFTLFVAMLAVRARIDRQDAFAMASDAHMERLTILLRAIDVERDMAASILSDLAVVNGLSEARLADQIDDFSALRSDEAKEALQPWQLDRGYRDAIAAIDAGLSGR